MNPVRVGVIGIGNMGWHHARVLSLIKEAELVGVADPDGSRGQLATEQFGCRWFPSYEAMLPEVDAVCIAVPTQHHHRVGLACLMAGVHVLIEKGALIEAADEVCIHSHATTHARTHARIHTRMQTLACERAI